MAVSKSFQHDLMIAEVAYEPSPLILKTTHPRIDGRNILIR